jgi:hypothetical protein
MAFFPPVVTLSKSPERGIESQEFVDLALEPFILSIQKMYFSNLKKNL